MKTVATFSNCHYTRAFGLPIADGVLKIGQMLCVYSNGKKLPLWWSIRGYWPSGNIKWIFLHLPMELAEGDTIDLVQEPDGVPPDNPDFSIHSNGFSCGSVAFFADATGWSIHFDKKEYHFQKEQTCFNGETPNGSIRTTILEPSAIAPLIQVDFVSEKIHTVHFLRLYVYQRTFSMTRRVSFLVDGNVTLSGSYCEIGVSSENLCESQEVFCLKHEDAPEKVRIHNGGITAEIEHGTRLFPCGLEWNQDFIRAYLWAPQAGEITLRGGTSLRHTIWIGEHVEFLSEDLPEYPKGYLANSGVFGVSYVEEEDKRRLTFPGFEIAYHRLLDQGIYPAICTDPDCFGILNYGDWPLKPGVYKAVGYRCYAANEYDMPYGYYQAFAAFSEKEYLQTARQCSLHMLDVDSNIMTGDMLYHSYNDTADNHTTRRSAKGELGHYWTDGMWYDYYMFGDVTAKEGALALTRHVCSLFPDRPQSFRNCWSRGERNLGWPLVVAAACCENTHLPEAKLLCEDIIHYVHQYMQNPEWEYETQPTQPLPWWRCAMLDGCKAFMVGVLLEGLERYHRLTGSPQAAECIITFSRFVCERLWCKWKGEFIYELNAMGRGHRGVNNPNLSPLIIRGIGYAYELTGDMLFREVSMQAFHACLWTLYSDLVDGKDIAIIGRNLNAFAAMARQWIQRDEAALNVEYPPSIGSPVCLHQPEPFVKIPLDSADTDSGRVTFSICFDLDSTDYYNQRSIFLLCGEKHNGPAVYMITFYRFLVVRIYDQDQNLIDTLDTTIDDCLPGGWQEGRWYQVCVE